MLKMDHEDRRKDYDAKMQSAEELKVRLIIT